MTLPRMSFEIVGYQYDTQRQLPRTNTCKINVATDGTNTRSQIYTKTPYNIQFQLNIYAKTQDEALQVVEQITPYFTPNYTLSVQPLPQAPEVVDDIPLTLNGISFSDDYEGEMAQRRMIIYTLDFEMKMDFYGPITEKPIIRTADLSYFLPAVDSDGDEGWALSGLTSITTDPEDASEDSDYTFVETDVLELGIFLGIVDINFAVNTNWANTWGTV